MFNYETPRETIMRHAQGAAQRDFKEGRNCDSYRYGARIGSAWDTWYTAEYRRLVKANSN